MESLRDQNGHSPAELDGLPGVNLAPYMGTSEERTQALESARILVDTGVEFAHCGPGRVPWLVAVHPFRMPPETRKNVERLGAATFAFFDAVQRLYAEGDPVVRNHLDANLPPDLCGRQVDKGVETFRLDMVLRNGAPKVTEVEEIYGNAGKMSALQRAYDVDYDALFRYFADRNISSIYLDDTLTDYYSELDLVRQELALNYGCDAPIRYFSEFTARQGGTVWRFCKTKDLAQYAADLRAVVAGSKCDFLNPLFSSYGTKAALALPFHPDLESKFDQLLGAEEAEVIREGFTRNWFLPERPEAGLAQELADELVESHRTLVLKLVDCPGGLDFTWGSRGVWFGDRSASRWRKAVEVVLAGRIPGHEELDNARYVVSELVESDRFDVPFLHPDLSTLALMPQGRIRLGPIFTRSNGLIRLVAGHATFVNTSRKVHLGKHAVCAPLVV